jgi:hypothetical protein|tara:strand:+ start:42 stop:206 length:165 start_codon:yes stop_codon:yes gene_type:complete
MSPVVINEDKDVGIQMNQDIIQPKFRAESQDIIVLKKSKEAEMIVQEQLMLEEQ